MLKVGGGVELELVDEPSVAKTLCEIRTPIRVSFEYVSIYLQPLV